MELAYDELELVYDMALVDEQHLRISHPRRTHFHDQRCMKQFGYDHRAIQRGIHRGLLHIRLEFQFWRNVFRSHRLFRIHRRMALVAPKTNYD